MPRGGKRKGAGRPKGSNKYGEPTAVVQVPVSLLPIVEAKLKGWEVSDADAT